MSEKKSALHPLTAEQSKFMEEHYGLLLWFLTFKWVQGRLPESKPFSMLDRDDVYDAALDGYMRAVQQYDERPELRKYSFSTIAVNDMRWELLRLLSRETRRMSRLNIDVSVYGEALKTLSETPISGEQYDYAEAADLWGRTKELVTERQGNVLRLRSFGYSYEEIAEQSGMKVKAVDNCLYRTRKKIRYRLAA